MVTYIYFVRCPGCEDEPFDFFNDAKDFALGCLSRKPIITQIEVDRNDFGECTNSCDLGTVWSWEDMMGEVDAEPTKVVFTKDDLKDYIPECDPEFDNLDNTIDFKVDEPETLKVSTIDEIPDNFRKPIPEGMTIEELVEEMEKNEDTVECVGCEELFTKDECVHKDDIGWLCGDCEDRLVKCTWCDELYDKSECRKEVDLGWLCSRCEAAIKSRGETLTFREGSYWDFLDEKLNLDIDLSNCIDSSDMEIWGVEQVKPGIYDAVLLKRFDNVDFKNFEGPLQAIHDEMLDIGGLFVFYFDKNGAPTLDSWNVELLRELGRCEIGFEDLRYETALEAQFNKAAAAAKTESFNEELELADLVKDSINHLTNDLGKDLWAEDFADVVIAGIENSYNVEVPEDPKKYSDWASAIACEVSRQLNNQHPLNEDVEFNYDDVEFDYDDLEVTLWGSKRDPETGVTDDYEFTTDYTYSVPSKTVASDLWSDFLTDADFDMICGGNCEDFDDETLWKLFVEKHFDHFVEKYNNELKDHYEEAAREAFQEENHGSYDEWYGNYWESLKTSGNLEKLEEAADYRKRLSLCPECGTDSFDSETGICVNCGFNILR